MALAKRIRVLRRRDCEATGWSLLHLGILGNYLEDAGIGALAANSLDV
jgi:hypothetical protein